MPKKPWATGLVALWCLLAPSCQAHLSLKASATATFKAEEAIHARARRPPRPSSVTRATGARKSTTTLLAPARRQLVPFTTPEHAMATAERERHYLALEAQATPEQRQALKESRRQIARKKLSFTVGLTSVAGKDLKKITGGLPPPPPDANMLKAKRAERATLRIKPNLLNHSRVLRATPPPIAPVARRFPLPHRDEDQAAAPTASAKNKRSRSLSPGLQDAATASSTSPYFSWKNSMTPVRNQGEKCGSCWAFASTAVLEAKEILLNGMDSTWLDLSEQQLVNCVPAMDVSGDNCQGNAPSSVWEYLGSHGLLNEAEVPYRAAMARCEVRQDDSFRVASWNYASDEQSEKPSVAEIKQAIVEHGPVTASVNATELFKRYKGGIFDEQDPSETNHAIVLLGWDDGRGAWLLRNSWGIKEWGEDGYMWIKYGSNSVGQWATWIDPVLVSKEPPGTQSYTDRFIGVSNRTGELLRVSVQAEVDDGTGFIWVPGGPGAGSKAFSFMLAPGTALYYKRSDNQQPLRARKIRLWAQSADGTRVWSNFRDTDLEVTPRPYTAEARQDAIIPLLKSAAPLPTAADLLAQAHALYDQGSFLDARAGYDQLIHAYPDDPRVHEARFWEGRTDLELDASWDAVLDFYGMIGSAPAGYPLTGYTFFFQGVAYQELGLCGHAVRDFEVVTSGEVDVPDDWVQDARDKIDLLLKDDGQRCSSWE
jgi:hypothetical protein